MTDKTIDDVLSEASAEIALKGVGKTGHNQQQGYRFRPVDEIINAVGPALAKRGVSVTVTFRDRTADRIPSKSGGTISSVTVTGDFVYRWRGQERVTTTIGEAMDSGDKATNKAMAMAVKYAHLLTLSIPVIGSDDADLKAHASASRLDVLEQELDPPADGPPSSASGEAPADVPPVASVGAAPFDSFPKTAAGATQYLDGIKAVLMGCDGDSAVATDIVNKHGDVLVKLRKAKDPTIAGNAASLLDYAHQVALPVGNPLIGG